MTATAIDRIIIAPLAHLGGAIVVHEGETILLINEALSQEEQERLAAALVDRYTHKQRRAA